MKEQFKTFLSQLSETNATLDYFVDFEKVKGKDENNHFFDDLYANFAIKRVLAKRSINANPEKRGVLNELLITNNNQFEKYERAV